MGQGHSLAGPTADWDAALTPHTQCTTALQASPHASYLVRRTPKGGSSELYLNDKGHVLQYDLEHPDGAEGKVSCIGVAYDGIDALLSHCAANGIQGQSGVVKLGQPVGKQAFTQYVDILAF